MRGTFGLAAVACGSVALGACGSEESSGGPPGADAVYVSASLGQDDAAGTTTAPKRTLSMALRVAKEQKKRIHMCAEDYREAITIEEGVEIYGHFECVGGWRVGKQRARLLPPSSPAIACSGVTGRARIEAIVAIAPAAEGPETNSIALLAAGCPGLSIVGSRLQARDARDGTSGLSEEPLVNDPTINGGDSVQKQVCTAPCAVSGGAGGKNGCGGRFAANPGGDGGNPGFSTVVEIRYPVVRYDPPFLESPGKPLASTPRTARGGAPLDGLVPPADRLAQAGSPGADGPSGIGGWSSAGYRPGSGKRGGDGTSGQGGGGGVGEAPAHHQLGTMVHGTIGPGGGAGGCPGLGGAPGSGGGASVGALILDGAITLEEVEIVTGKGGNGGEGRFGSPGQPGGAPGASYIEWAPAQGMAGGRGGDGGFGGHGSAGPSVGIAVHGREPVQVAVTFRLGQGGKGAPAASSGTKTIPATPDGDSKAILVLD